MSIDRNKLTSQAARSARRPASTFVYIVVAAITALLTGVSIVWLETYSDKQSMIETTLSRIQAHAYHLATVEETAHAEKSFSPELTAEDDEVDAQIRTAIAVIRNAGAKTVASKLTTTFRALDGNLNIEYAMINHGRADDAEVLAASSVDPLFDALNDEVADANKAAESGADRANAVASGGSVALLGFAAIVVSILFRRFTRSQRSITQLITQQATLQQSERRFKTLVQSASDFIVIVAPNSIIKIVVSAAERVWAQSPVALRDTPILSLVLDEDVVAARELINEVCRTSGATVSGELRLRHGDGVYRPAEVVMTNLIAEEEIEEIVVNCRDISERKAAEAKMAHQAFHDPLTDLPNRALFMERLGHALTRGQRSQYQIAVIFLDLDNFKVINDSLGHEAGDTLLKSVAERLKSLIRPGDTVARLGGDEFTILLEDLDADTEAVAVAERISEVMRTSISIDRRDVFAMASMGIAISRGDYTSADDLLRDADTAMYQAKTTAKGHSVMFDLNMNARAVERLELEIDLHNALDSDELRVYYQPIISLDSGAITEVEALVRWQHPTRGLILPAVFIPIAEESGLIVNLGAWILEKACVQFMEWQRESPGGELLTVSVNLSVRQLHEPDLVSTVAAILERVGMNARHLKLEVTESVMLRDPVNMTAKLEALKALGIHIAVNDFGTGYSSMSYLSGLPIDTLKIDRSFVSKIGRSEEDDGIVRAIVTLAKALNLCITAEGIETQEQLERLRSLNCELGQGFLYSQAVSAGDMTALLSGDNYTEVADVTGDLSRAA